MSYSAKWQQAVDRLEIEQQDLLLIMELRKQGLLKSADDSPIKILRKLIEQARMCDENCGCLSDYDSVFERINSNEEQTDAQNDQ